MAQQIANQDITIGGDAKETCWALVIKESDYKFNHENKVKCCYFEYSLPGNYLVIIAQSLE